MACNSCQSTCSCVVIGDPPITVTGIGSAANPYVVDYDLCADIGRLTNTGVAPATTDLVLTRTAAGVCQLARSASDSLVANPDGSYTHTAVDGTVVTIPAPVAGDTDSLVDNGDFTFTHTAVDGTAVTICDRFARAFTFELGALAPDIDTAGVNALGANVVVNELYPGAFTIPAISTCHDSNIFVQLAVHTPIIAASVGTRRLFQVQYSVSMNGGAFAAGTHNLVDFQRLLAAEVETYDIWASQLWNGMGTVAAGTPMTFDLRRELFTSSSSWDFFNLSQNFIRVFVLAVPV